MPLAMDAEPRPMIGWSIDAAAGGDAPLVGADVAWLALSAPPESLAPLAWDTGQRTTIVAAPTSKPEFGPLHFSAMVVGLPRVQRDVMLPRWTGGAVPVLEIRLGPAPPAACGLRVTFTGTRDLGVAAPDGRFGGFNWQVRIRQLDPVAADVQSYWQVRLRAAPPEPVVFPALPEGRWRVSLQRPLPPRGATTPFWDVDIRAGQICELPIDVSGMSAINADLTFDDGARPYGSGASFTLFLRSTNSAAMWSLPGPPYVLTGVLPGEYDLAVSGAGFERTARTPVSVAPGRVVPVDVPLKRPPGGR